MGKLKKKQNKGTMLGKNMVKGAIMDMKNYQNKN